MIKRLTFVCSFLIACFLCSAQPYLDLAKINYYHSPAGKRSDAIGSRLYSININLPVELKKGGDAIIVNPFYDNNEAEIGVRDIRVSSAGLMAGFLKKRIAPRFDLLTSIIIRKNKKVNADVDSDLQGGGLLLATFKQKESRSFKFGLYYNREFFGNFFMPLLGIDWKINDKNTLFGILPGSMILEHKLNQRLYIGGSFRALTNSYRLPVAAPCLTGDCSAKNYLRINDNQLGVFADVYVFKGFVFSAEAGHTIMRRYRFGVKGKKLHSYNDFEDDNWYVKAGLAYRLRFAGR